MHRSAPATPEKAHAPAPRIRLARVLACGAVPVMLVAAGCSSGSGGDASKDSSASASASASGSKQASASPAPAKFAKLPDACKTVTPASIDKYVPKAKTKAGEVGKTSDPQAQASCTWNGLDDKGVQGSLYRWLDVDLKRYDSTAGLGSGESLAHKQFDRAVSAAQATADAKNVKTSPVPGLGDQATAITFDLKKTDADFKYGVVVVRTANAVVTVDYNGTGYQGADAPQTNEVQEGATVTAKETVATVATANNK